MVRTDDRRARYTLFLLLAVTINVLAGVMLRSATNERQRMTIAAAGSFDMVVTVAAVYYGLLVRPGIRSKWSMVPIALAGLLHATYLYPNTASARPIVAGLCELAIVGFVVAQVRNKVHPQEALGRMNILATEFSIIYYALFSWRATPHVPAGTQAFTIYKKAAHRDLLYGMALVSLIEMLPAHLLIHHWSPVAAWIATALSLYAAAWLIGLARSVELRPVLVGPDYADIRYGLLFRLRIPREMIKHVRSAQPEDAVRATVLPRRSEPNVCIELSSAMQAQRLFGMRKKVKCIAMAADDEPALEQALRDLRP